jgi:hypothetical protein
MNPLMQSDGPMLIPSLQGFFYPATFVRLYNGVIGCLRRSLRGAGYPMVELEIFTPFVEAERSFSISRRPIMEPSLMDIQEVVKSGGSSVVRVDEIEDLVFVFHMTQLTLDYPHAFLQGMRMVKLCRFDGNGDAIDPQQWATFPSDMECYKQYSIQCPNRDIWQSLVAIQCELHQMLGRLSEKQGMFSKNTGNLRFLPFAWHYILRACGEATGNTASL